MRRYKVCVSFGQKVQRIRKAQSLSQEDLAEKVGVHRNHVGRIERGETNPPLTLVAKIARVLILEKYDGFLKNHTNWLEPQEWRDILAKNEDLRPSNLVWLPTHQLTRTLRGIFTSPDIRSPFATV